jgi:hypothetical protein
MTKTFVQRLLLAWFIALSLFVLVPSFLVLTTSTGDLPVLKPIPPPPEPPASATESEVARHTLNVTAYQQYVTAYTAYSQIAKGRGFDSKFELVVMKTLLPLLDKLVVAFLTYAFVVAAATTVDNANRLRNNQPPEQMKFF